MNRPPTPTRPPARHPVHAAVVDFLAADPTRAARFLAGHTLRRDGRCAGCFPAAVPWPCPVHPLAVEAADRAGLIGLPDAPTPAPAPAPVAVPVIPAPRRPAPVETGPRRRIGSITGTWAARATAETAAARRSGVSA